MAEPQRFSRPKEERPCMIQGPCIPIGLLDAVTQHSREWKLRRSSFTFVSHACIFGVCVREKSPLASLPASQYISLMYSHLRKFRITIFRSFSQSPSNHFFCETRRFHALDRGNGRCQSWPMRSVALWVQS